MECGKVLRLQARHCLNLQYFLFLFFLRPLLPTRKLQNRNEFPPGKPNKRNRLFLLGSFESNILWNTTYFGARPLGTFIPGSWRIAARITSLQYFLFGALTRKKIPLLTALPGSSIKIIRDLRKPHAAFVCLHAFVIVAFQLFNMPSSEIMHEFRSGRFSKSLGLSASVSSLSPPFPPTSLFRARPISRWKRLLRRQTSNQIHGSFVFYDDTYLALSDILQLILTAQKTSIQYVFEFFPS